MDPTDDRSERTPDPMRRAQSPPPVSRRRLIADAGAGVVGVGFTPLLSTEPAFAADTASSRARPAADPTTVAAGSLVAPNRFPRMVHEHFVQRQAARPERSATSTPPAPIRGCR